MLKKTLLTAAAALAVTAGAATLSAPEAKAGVNVQIGFGHHGWHGGHWGHFGYGCFTKWQSRKVWYWHNGHKHWKWVKYPVRFCY